MCPGFLYRALIPPWLLSCLVTRSSRTTAWLSHSLPACPDLWGLCAPATWVVITTTICVDLAFEKPHSFYTFSFWSWNMVRWAFLKKLANNQQWCEIRSSEHKFGIVLLNSPYVPNFTGILAHTSAWSSFFCLLLGPSLGQSVLQVKLGLTHFAYPPAQNLWKGGEKPFNLLFFYIWIELKYSHKRYNLRLGRTIHPKYKFIS